MSSTILANPWLVSHLCGCEYNSSTRDDRFHVGVVICLVGGVLGGGGGEGGVYLAVHIGDKSPEQGLNLSRS